jgi:glycosyltransferase involved in cell wall biosynthesis
VTVGVIVPVYAAIDEAPYLAQALDGVLEQQPPPDRVIVVDDGSPVPVRLAGAHASRCQLVRRERRGGPGPARDTALALLETEFVACADADDVWLKDKLPTQLRALERERGAALCFGAAMIIGSDGEPTGERWRTFDPGPLTPSVLGPLLFEHNPIPTSSVLARRTALLAAGGFAGPPQCEDWALWLRLLERGEGFVFAPEARVAYRRHSGSVTANVAALAEAAMAVHEAHRGLVDEQTYRRVRAADLTALARGRIRQRHYAAARAGLAAAAALQPPGARDRALRAALSVPGLRALLGRRRPY